MRSAPLALSPLPLIFSHKSEKSLCGTGIQTCYDGYFPEPMRALSLQGAEIVLWPNSRGGSIRPDVVSVATFYNFVHVVAANSANGERRMHSFLFVVLLILSCL